MNDLAVTALLIACLFLILGSGVWIGLTLAGVAWIGMQLFSTRPAGDAMAVTIWGTASSWTLTALPLFVWMGEILFRTRLSQDMFRGLAPWMQALPGRLLHVNVAGCAIFAAVSGSSAATCATIGKMSLPELNPAATPTSIAIGSLAGAGTLGLLIPPSIIMIVYGVSADVSIAELFIAGVVPGILLAALFSGYIMLWALRNPGRIPPRDADAGPGAQAARIAPPDPRCCCSLPRCWAASTAASPRPPRRLPSACWARSSSRPSGLAELGRPSRIRCWGARACTA